jgi:diguanylate cyclase (GGDEF)-like protein
MTAAEAFWPKLLERVRDARRAGIQRFSLWLLPLVIAIGSITALLAFSPLYPSTSGESLYFRSLPLEAGHSTLDEATAALQTIPQQRRTEFEHGAWVAIELPENARLQPTAVDFPAKGAEAITCWRRDTRQQLGSIEGRHATGAMRTNRLGHVLMLGQNEAGAGATFTDLICRVSYSQPTVFTADLWAIPDLRTASDRFHRSVALLDGGVLTLAVVLTIIALGRREWVFLLAAMWLLGNLRLGAYTLGWDGQWLGYLVPSDWQPLLRQFTLAAYFLVSYSLFTRLFKGRTDPYPRLSEGLQWLGVAQLAAAFLLPWEAFRYLSAGIWSVSLGACLYLLLKHLARKPSHLLSWRLLTALLALSIIIASLGFTLLGTEPLAATTGNVVILLLSNILVALAVEHVIGSSKTERMRAQTDLVTSYAVAPLGLFTLDSDGRFLQTNPILRDMLGLEEEAVSSHGWNDFFPPQVWSTVAAATLSGKETDVHLPATPEGDPAKHFALRAALAGDHIEGSLQDITARAHAMNELRGMVDNDPLTQALNRHGIEKELERAIESLRRDNVPCSLAYMDLDHFKRINGLFGHVSGDEILKQITTKLRKVLTERQPVGRIGSDEFIIVFPNMGAAEARETAEHIIADLNGRSYQVGHRHFHVRSAIGVVEINKEMDTAAAISAATRACRDARKQHQDVVVYEQNSSELQAHSEELRLFDQLEGGASPRGLYLEMQPIMSLIHPDETLNFEILLRVRDSHGKLLPTGQIVSAAEESGTVTIIDKWVFSATLEWLSKHEDRLRKTQLVNVNLSGVSLNDDKFIDMLFQVLGRYSQLARRLCVEITEGVALQNLDRTQRLIQRLKSMGVRIALDDFGAGYTSFSYLKQLGADAVKIDGTLVRDMLASDTNIAIVRTIVELAQNLGMVSIAEWVEDVQTLEVLREMGVDYVQGYAISPALTPMEILDAESMSDLVSNADTLSYIRRNSPPPTLTLIG